MRDFRLPPRCKRDLLSFGNLRSVDRLLVTDVSVQPVCHISEGQILGLLDP